VTEAAYYSGQGDVKVVPAPTPFPGRAEAIRAGNQPAR